MKIPFVKIPQLIQVMRRGIIQKEYVTYNFFYKKHTYLRFFNIVEHTQKLMICILFYFCIKKAKL